MEEKKISIQLMLFSFFGTILCYISKSPYHYRKEQWAAFLENKIEPPMYFFKVDLFGFQVAYKSALIFLVLLMALGVYWFLTKNDSEIKISFARYYRKLGNSDFYKSLSVKTSNLIHRSKGKNIFEKKESTNEVEINQNPTELKERKKITLLKNISLISGILLLILYFILNKYFEDQIAIKINKLPAYYNDTSNYFNPANTHYIKSSIIRHTYKGYSYLLSIGVRIYSFVICWLLAKYNKGNYFLWGLSALLIPYISLLFAGVRSTLKEEYK